MANLDRECGGPPCKVARLEADEHLESASTSISGETATDSNKHREKRYFSCNESNIESDGSDECSYEYDSEEHCEVPKEEEIDALLEMVFQNLDSEVDQKPEIREKIVLDDKYWSDGKNLPEGWIKVTHCSGMPVYLHRSSRVCTMSKPYFIGAGSLRKHNIPVSAIPCLQYLQSLHEEGSGGETAEAEKVVNSTQESELLGETSTIQKHDANIQDSSGEVSNRTAATNNDIPDVNSLCPPPDLLMDNAKIEAPLENSLSATELREYCQKRFLFKVIKINKLTWKQQRKYKKDIKIVEFKENGFQYQKSATYVGNLHVYVQKTFKLQPQYVFKEVAGFPGQEDQHTTYAATITIHDRQYGTGYGTSKKMAKNEAAKNTLEILIPDLVTEIIKKANTRTDDTEIIFYKIPIEDSIIYELVQKLNELTPYQILLNYLYCSNFCVEAEQIQTKFIQRKYNENEYIIIIGPQTVKVPCYSEKNGKQRAAQALLQKLHPHMNSYGSILRLYRPHQARNNF